MKKGSKYLAVLLVVSLGIGLWAQEVPPVETPVEAASQPPVPAALQEENPPAQETPPAPTGDQVSGTEPAPVLPEGTPSAAPDAPAANASAEMFSAQQPASPGEENVPSQGAALISGKYILKNSSNYFDLGSDGTFNAQVNGKTYHGTYKVKGDTVTSRFQVIRSDTFRIVGDTLVTKKGSIWEKQGARPLDMPTPALYALAAPASAETPAISTETTETPVEGVVIAAQENTESATAQSQTDQDGAPTPGKKRAKKKGKFGMIIGAIGGAVVGYALTGKAEGALTGAAAGALIGGGIGFAIGKRQDKLLASRDQVIREEYGGVVPTADLLEIKEHLRIEPQVVQPGGKVDLICSYNCIPPLDSTVPMVEYCEYLRLPDGKMELLRKGECPVDALGPTKGGGWVETAAPMKISASMAPGDYVAILEITWGDQKVSTERMFQVQESGG